MKISDEAVEAAAKVMFEQSSFGTTTWEDVREVYCTLMEKSLEAAAPYMRAPACTGGMAHGDH